MMKRKLVFEMLLAVVIAGFLALTCDIQLAKSESITIIRVSPSTSESNPSNHTTITIEIINVTGLFAFQFNLTWLPDVVEVENESMLVEGDFLKRGGNYTTLTEVKLNQTMGYAFVGAVLLGGVIPATGSGDLYNITFHMKAFGASLLHLSNTRLLDQFGAFISHRTEDGYMQVIPEFPSFLILPILIIATLFAVIVYKKKQIT